MHTTLRSAVDQKSWRTRLPHSPSSQLMPNRSITRVGRITLSRRSPRGPAADQHNRVPARSYSVSRGSNLLQDPFDRETWKQPITCLRLAALQIAFPVKRAALHSGKLDRRLRTRRHSAPSLLLPLQGKLDKGCRSRILALTGQGADPVLFLRVTTRPTTQPFPFLLCTPLKALMGKLVFDQIRHVSRKCRLD